MSNFAVARSTLLILLLLSSSVACVRAAPDKVTVPLIAEGKPDPADPSVTGYLFRPEGGGPFPAVLLRQGGAGLAPAAAARLASTFRARRALRQARLCRSRARQLRAARRRPGLRQAAHRFSRSARVGCAERDAVS